MVNEYTYETVQAELVFHTISHGVTFMYFSDSNTSRKNTSNQKKSVAKVTILSAPRLNPKTSFEGFINISCIIYKEYLCGRESSLCHDIKRFSAFEKKASSGLTQL